MWETAVRVEQSAAVSVSPDLAWSLLNSPQAWSARPPGALSYGLDRPDEPGGCRFLLADTGGTVAAAVLDVSGLGVVNGQRIGLQAAGGRTAWELGAEPGKRGALIRLAAARTVERPMKIEADVAMRAELRGWLQGLSAILEGRAPWPGTAIPESLRHACVVSQPVEKAFEVSAAVLINAPPEVVGRAVGTPELLRASAPDSVVFCGWIPGTPAGQVGGMTYQVQRVASGDLLPIVSLRAAAAPGTAMMRHVTPPFAEVTYRWEASSQAGTRLELTHGIPASLARAGLGDRAGHAAAVEVLARRYKAAIEARPAAG